MMEKEFVPYYIALSMNKLGFDEVCLALYNGEVLTLNSYHTNSDFKTHNRFHELKITAPTYSQAFRWFREEYELDSFVRKIIGVDGERLYCYEVFKKVLSDSFKTYQEAQDACIRKLIEIVEENL
jgi:hypothetical protein